MIKRTVYKPRIRAIEQDDGTWNIYRWRKPWFRAGRWEEIASGLSEATIAELTQ